MSLRELLPTLEAWRTDGAGVGRAVLVRAFHSSPRSPGAVLLAADDGRFAGSVSGGCVEGAAAGEVRGARRDGRSRVIRYGISDDLAWDVGLACGGIIDVLVEPEIRPEAIAAADAAAHGRGFRRMRPVTSSCRSRPEAASRPHPGSWCIAPRRRPPTCGMPCGRPSPTTFRA